MILEDLPRLQQGEGAALLTFQSVVKADNACKRAEKFARLIVSGNAPAVSDQLTQWQVFTIGHPDDVFTWIDTWKNWLSKPAKAWLVFSQDQFELATQAVTDGKNRGLVASATSIGKNPLRSLVSMTGDANTILRWLIKWHVHE
ncbi:hypothetical protein C5B42_04285 [Candidatus Cerribacteria bacterium 'Amazon FNV 2010 28 9']|uniref:Uncharacterized protein n=1 Tax=Candidatus Cerribacteria bacterium 'Amazon FNV 2010 28 9' TaxID=2081795 RepID=A0A317JMZ3_9BACT|nr:MAG: hypothetical protein C5B42_04285 [Candidatus Cerribacteria bacterium 'Amazon FNV 2010 28 9']